MRQKRLGHKLGEPVAVDSIFVCAHFRLEEGEIIRVAGND